ncbi:WD40 repeat domain-containing protein [Phanerochaete sordida]|uniref:WD40 repeat domain-containing protein n=1 Tax=Phanerochaete sordida TaxID=48140 RepID=A0A9P3GJU9_9APHY|nr:WD40 repeat domain-containing protein [Phanerochaete sordida]
MFKLHQPSTPAQIYAHSLKQLSLGRALWYPEPHDTGEPQVGDVGYLSDGAFVRLFNLDTSDPNKKVTYWKPRSFVVDEELPEGVLKIDRRRQPLARGEYSSHGVEKRKVHASADITAGPNASVGLSAEYSCKATFGAVLELKSDPHAQTIYENTELKEYILRNHGKWRTYVTNVLKQPVRGRDLVMISGWVKTEANWAAAAFASTHVSSSVSLSGQAGGVASVSTGASRATSMTGPTMHRHGEAFLEGSADTTLQHATDQCVFVKRYKVRHRMAFLRRIVAGAGNHQLPRSSGGGTLGEMKLEAREEEYVGCSCEDDDGESTDDPVDVLLGYIFETSPVDVAIAGDDDVDAITGGNRIVDLSSYLRKVRPPVTVTGGAGLFSVDDVVRHKCLRHVLLGARTRRSRFRPDVEPGTNSGRFLTVKDVRGRIGASLHGGRPVLLPALALKDPCNPSKGGPTHLAVSADRSYIAAVFGSSDITIFRADDARPIQRLRLEDRRLEAHLSHAESVRGDQHRASESLVDASYLKFSPDGRTLVSVWQTNGLNTSFVVVFWDVRSGCATPARIASPNGSATVTTIAWDLSQARIALATQTSGVPSLDIWNVASGYRLSTIQLPSDFRLSTIFRVDFIRNSAGNDIICFGGPESCHIYDLEAKSYLSSIHASSHLLAGPATVIPAGIHPSPGVRLLSELEKGKAMAVRDAYTGDELLQLSHPNPLILPAGLSPDGTEAFVTCREEHALLTYDIRTGALRHVYQIQGDAARGAYSPDGRFLAVALMSGDIQVYDSRSTKLLLTIEGGEANLRDHRGFARALFSEGWNTRVTFAPVPIDKFVFLADSETLLVERVDDTHLINVADTARMRA